MLYERSAEQNKRSRWIEPSTKSARRRRAIIHKAIHAVEQLESRILLTTVDTSTLIDLGGILLPNPALLSAPFAPTSIDSAYGINQISFNGTSGTGAGQTIAIVDAFNDPNIVGDASTFNTQFSLPQFNTGGPTLTVLNQNGQSSALPTNASPGTWDLEESLDVEWAHAVAPQANIILFESNTNNLSDLLT